MSLALANIRTAQSAPLPIFTFYGVPKVGKTSLAAEFPAPIYINTPGESPPAGIEITTPGEIEAFDDVMDLIAELLTQPHDRKTLIIDSIDGFEPIVWAHACRINGWSNIEEPGYGKGYVAADEVWREFLRAIEALAAAGMAVVLIGHSEVTRFDSPVSDPYSRYGIKLHKRAAAMLQEASSVIGFLDYRVTLKEKDVGFNKKVSRGAGSGERQVHLEERPGFTAGNRFGMPPMIPFKTGEGYAALAKHFPEPTGIRQAA